jgi:apolipoprotein N-acyltransferase
MIQKDAIKNRGLTIRKIRPYWYLVIGVFTLTASQFSFNIDLAAYIACVPFLIYLSITKGWKTRLLFFLALIMAWSVATAKIISSPLSYIFVFLYSVPLSLVQLPGYLIWDRFKNHKWAVLIFPAVMTLMEWIQYTFTPFASWGVAAYTQSHSIYLMQSVSLFGMAGLSFVIYWINTSIAGIVVTRKMTPLTFQFPFGILILLIVFGAFRYDISKSQGREVICVAAIGTDSKVGGLPLPAEEIHARNIAGLLERTRIAAKAGAELVVWNEAATFVLPDNEPVWIDSLKALADGLDISLVASYVVPVSQGPLKYENKYLFCNPSGDVAYTYLKHQPVPGEPAIQGHEPLEVIDVAGTKMGGVVCYDYDFPYLAKGFGKLHADIVAVPSSDWRGIDPIHTRMAAFRAVEQGHSVLRSTRFGLSAAITPYGEMISQMSSFDQNNKIMIAHLPVKGVVTIYSIIGDTFVFLCILFIASFIIQIILLKRRAAEVR